MIFERVWTLASYADFLAGSYGSAQAQSSDLLVDLNACMDLAGWTLQGSCDSIHSGATNYLASAASVHWDTGGTSHPFSYFWRQSPNSFLYPYDGSKFVQNVVKTNSASNSQCRRAWLLSTHAGSFDSSPLIYAPDHPVSSTYVDSTIWTIHPTSTLEDLRRQFWYTSRGDFVWSVAQKVSPFYSTMHAAIACADDPDMLAEGDFRFIYRADNPQNGNVWSRPNWSPGTGVWHAPWCNGSGDYQLGSNTNAVLMSHLTGYLNSGSTGKSSASGAYCYGGLFALSSASVWRPLGRVPDIRLAPDATPFGKTPPSDPDAWTLMSWGSSVANGSGIWMPCPSGALPTLA